MNIIIKDFPVDIVLGYFPEEQKAQQTILISLNAELYDQSSAAKRDDLDLTVDYSRLFALCGELLAGKKFKLIETVVWNLGEGMLSQLSGVKSLHVEVVKQIIPKIKTSGARVSVAHLFTRNERG